MIRSGPSSLAQIPEHEFSKRTDAKSQLNNMDSADSASSGMSNIPDRLSPANNGKENGGDSGRSSGQSFSSSSAGDKSTKGFNAGTSAGNNGVKGSRASDGSGTSVGQPARPTVKIFFTEGSNTASAVGSGASGNSASSAGDSRPTERESLSANVGNQGEVERVSPNQGTSSTGGSGVMGNLVHAQGGQGQLLQGVGHRYSYPVDNRANLRSFRSPPVNQFDRVRASYRLNPLPPAVLYDSRPSIAEPALSQDRWLASNRPLPVRPYGVTTVQSADRDFNFQTKQPESGRSANSNADRKAEFVVSSNLIEFPTASLYPRPETSDRHLVNSNVLKIQ